jgi:phosphosulfolactate synthase
MTQTVFPMLKVLALPPKPRTRALMLVSEFGISLRETEDLLEVAAPLIDYAKITDHTGLIDRLSARWLRRKIALYNAHDVHVLPGGIPFQIAVLQGKAEEYLKRVRELGFAGVEISEDVIDPMAAGRREEIIGHARGLGLMVTTEVGRKNLDAAFDVDAILQQIERDVAVGAAKIYIESSEIQEIYRRDPAALDRLARSPHAAVLLFELGLSQAQEKAAWLVERYGPDINFASVSPVDVTVVDAIRRGMHRKANYRYLMRK